jgi:phospholipid-binding lipoprotein MlaA
MRALFSRGHWIVASWFGHLRLYVLLFCLGLTGCASGPHANPADPLEPFNRSMYKFNDAVDQAVLKPVATAYRDVTPDLVRRGVGNFFANLQDAWSFVNNVLQLKGEAAASSLMRFSFNTVFGLGGVLDWASEMKMPRYTEDFGQTLGYWGVGAGPYVVLPLLGPSTLRDTVALPVDFKGDAVSQIDSVPVRNTLLVTRAVDQRAELLKAESVLEAAALDKYAFIRDAFMQRRRNAVYDGNPPDEEPMDDPASQEADPK